MPRANGYDLNAKRISRDRADFDIRYDGERVRGPLPMKVLATAIRALKDGKVTESALLAFLQGGEQDANLLPGKEPVTLRTFLFDQFLPNEKKPAVGKRTYATAINESKRLAQTIGDVHLHEIRPSHAKAHKEARQKLGMANVSTKQDLITLGEAMDYAVECGLIAFNLLLPVKGLPCTDRTSTWLFLKDIAGLMRCLPRRVKVLTYFLILTGARIHEALAMTSADIDWERRVIRIPNSKRRRRSPSKGKRMRTLEIDDLGPRLEWLLRTMVKPDPVSGHLFPGRFPGKAMSAACVEDLFHRGVEKAGLEHLIPPEIIESGGHPHVVPHDSRRTFANHGAIAEWSFQKIRNYMGQINAASIQAYLDEAGDHEPSESIFRHPPRRMRGTPGNARLADGTLHAHVPPPAAGPRPAYWN